MYFQNPPSPPGPQAPLGSAAPQAAQPLLPPIPPALPVYPSAVSQPQGTPRAVLPDPRPSSRLTAPGVLRGKIVPQTLRFFNNGVSRFRFRPDVPDAQPVSCVIFKNASESLPADAFSVGRHLELRGYARKNHWTDRQGNAHDGTDFVVNSIIINS